MTRISRFFILFFCFSITGVTAFWTGFVKYTPAPRIFLSGSNSEVRFDVAEVLYNSSSLIPAPFIDTNTKIFSGAFYLSGAGWVLWNTGSYVTNLDCWSQYLSWLTSNCTLSGYAWSETIGDIVFDRRVEYLPANGTLSGKISTNMGDISLDTVILPLLPMNLAWVANFSPVANSGLSITLLNYLQFASSGGITDITFTPLGTSLPYSYVNTSSCLADLSLASQYTLVLTDQNASKTEYLYNVTSAEPSFALDSNITSTQKYSFCSLNPADTRCADDAILYPTRFTNTVNGVSSSTNIADGLSYIDTHLKLRDRYGNSVNTGTLDIYYHAPTQVIQTTESPYFSSIIQPAPFPVSVSWDAVILSWGLLMNFWDGAGTMGALGINLWLMQNLEYGFSSYAPGNIDLQSIRYNGVDLWILSPSLIFSSWYSLDNLESDSIKIGMQSVFTGTMTNHSSRNDTNPMILHGISIGNNVYAVFSSFSASPWLICQADELHLSAYTNECDWSTMDGKSTPSLYVRSLSPTSSLYSFTGIYTPLPPFTISSVPAENVIASSYISYIVSGHTVIYPTKFINLWTSESAKRRLRIFGQSYIGGWNATDHIGKETKTDFLNTLRKKISILTRNQTASTNSAYFYTGATIHIGNALMSSHRTLIVEGNDIYIDQNIDLQNYPLAIIALKNPVNGSWGTIHISSGVTDIHATLIGESVFTSTGNNQLYIHGTIVSNTTLGGASKATPECPYFVNLPCTFDRAKLYDLEYMRSDYLNLPSTIGHTALASTAMKYQDSAVIVDYDSRIQSDPPPGFEN